jgi:hypothetical protein
MTADDEVSALRRQDLVLDTLVAAAATGEELAK